MYINEIINKNKSGLIISICIHMLIFFIPFSLMVSPVLQKEIELFVFSDEKPPAPMVKTEKKKPEKKEILKEQIIESTVQSESNEAMPVAPPPPVEKAYVEYKAEPKALELRDVEFGSSEGPRFYRKEMPVYPFMARRLGKEGRVVLGLTIDDKGKLLKLEIIEGAGFGFTESAVEAVRKSTFIPAKKEGKPIPSRALLPIKFTLRKTDD
jgi:protein TonB